MRNFPESSQEAFKIVQGWLKEFDTTLRAYCCEADVVSETVRQWPNNKKGGYKLMDFRRLESLAAKKRPKPAKLAKRKKKS